MVIVSINLNNNFLKFNQECIIIKFFDVEVMPMIWIRGYFNLLINPVVMLVLCSLTFQIYLNLKELKASRIEAFLNLALFLLFTF